VIYTRVSTAEQGRSGLGLAAQERDIEIFLNTFSEVPFEVLGRFSDVQSGKDDDRPELGKALEVAKRTGAQLLIAKLDRLSRDVAFIASTMKEIQVKCASMPNADNFQLHIYAALAEKERKFISERTRAALTAAKARGKRLGGYREGSLEKRNAALRDIADADARRVLEVVKPLRDGGKTLQQIADVLTNTGIRTPRGGVWTATQVKRTLARAATVETRKAEAAQSVPSASEADPIMASAARREAAEKELEAIRRKRREVEEELAALQKR
jgi:DNA invertase Pin-like site-specific DNA recombinase